MPLPVGGNMPWPPKSQDRINEKISEWSAWYSGNVEQLAAIYGGPVAYDSTGFYSSQTGGIKAAVERVARWFWGTKHAVGEKRTKLHVPVAGDIARASADLLFSEKPKVKSEDSRVQDVLNKFNNPRMQATLMESAEIASGMGGVYLRAVWDKDINPKGPWTTGIYPNVAVPEWSWGILTAVTFWRQLSDVNGTVLRHLERHERGYIYHALYEGDADTLGRVIPITEHEETAALKDHLTDGDRIETGIPKLTVDYVSNMRPNRVWGDLPAASALGRADIAGTESFMDALDETWTSWMRDLRLGKARIIVPKDYLDNLGPGQGASFNPEKEIYQALAPMPEPGMHITPVQFAIRVDEHMRTAQALWETIVRTAGYSAQTFGETAEGSSKGRTATEVRAEQRSSFLTRDKKLLYWSPALSSHFETLMMLDSSIFDSPVEAIEPDVEFGDSVSEDPESISRTLALLETARAISIHMKVKTLHPEWEKEEVDREVARIKAEQGITAEVLLPEEIDV
jgi:A118 family predicted phage portal protein